MKILFFVLLGVFMLIAACNHSYNQDQQIYSKEQDSLYVYFVEMAKEYEHLGDASISLLYYDSALEIKSSDGILNDRGLLKLDNGDLEGALVDITRANKINNGAYNTNIAYVLMEMGNEDDAFQILENQLITNQDTCGYLFDKAYFTSKKGDLNSFEEIKKKLISLCPESELSKYIESNHIELLLRLGDTSKACSIIKDSSLIERIRRSFAEIHCE